MEMDDREAVCFLPLGLIIMVIKDNLQISAHVCIVLEYMYIVIVFGFVFFSKKKKKGKVTEAVCSEYRNQVVSWTEDLCSCPASPLHCPNPLPQFSPLASILVEQAYILHIPKYCPLKKVILHAFMHVAQFR